MYSAGMISLEAFKKVTEFSSDPELASPENNAFEKQMLEIDLMTRGMQVEMPLEFEDHVEHLKAIYTLVQSIEFAEMPEPIRQQIIMHGMTHEMFAWKRGQVSQIYALKVLQYVQWLWFAALPEAMPVGVNNPGTPLENLVSERAASAAPVDATNNLIPGANNPEAV